MAVAAITRDRYETLAGQVRLLSWLSLAWMTVEGAVAIGAGIVAGSIALVGFGLDSAIEGFASVIIIWRFTGQRVFSHAAEERAQRLVAVQFFLLAPYVGFESVKALVGGEHPQTSWVGIALAMASVVLMPILAVAKQRLADQLGSAATAGEGRQNMLCAYLAGALLLGLLGNALLGAWWLDPAVGPAHRRRRGEGGRRGVARRGLLRELAAGRRRLRRRRRATTTAARTERGPSHRARTSDHLAQSPCTRSATCTTSCRPIAQPSCAGTTRSAWPSSRQRGAERRERLAEVLGDARAASE